MILFEQFKDVFYVFVFQTLLRALVEYTNEESEKRRLQEFCSAQGTFILNLFSSDVKMGLFVASLSRVPFKSTLALVASKAR